MSSMRAPERAARRMTATARVMTMVVALATPMRWDLILSQPLQHLLILGLHTPPTHLPLHQSYWLVLAGGVHPYPTSTLTCFLHTSSSVAVENHLCHNLSSAQPIEQRRHFERYILFSFFFLLSIYFPHISRSNHCENVRYEGRGRGSKKKECP